MRNYIWIFATIMATIFVPQSAVAQFNYPDFASTSGLSLSGNASKVSNLIRVNPATWQTIGYVEYGSPQSVSLGFNTTFTFRYWNISGLIDTNGNKGTDGIALYIGSLSTNRALDISFDAWDNQASDTYGYPDDISSSRVQVRCQDYLLNNPDVYYQTDVEPLGIVYRNEGSHTVNIEYTGGSFKISMDGLHIGTYAVDMSDFAESTVRIRGFAGGAMANQDLMSWSFSPVPEPSSLLALASSVIGLAGLRRRAKK